MNESTAKTCYACQELKPLEQFHRSSRDGDGRQPRCKECDSEARRKRNESKVISARMAESRRAAREVTLAAGFKMCAGCTEKLPLSTFQAHAASLDGLHRLCKPCRRLEKRRSYLANKEAVLERNKANYQTNRIKYLQSVARWQKENRELRREYEGRRRARKRTASVGKIDIATLSFNSCPICGMSINSQLVAPHPMSKSLDHIIPLARGGSHEQSNLQWTHLRCNIRKGARLTE